MSGLQGDHTSAFVAWRIYLPTYKNKHGSIKFFFFRPFLIDLMYVSVIIV